MRYPMSNFPALSLSDDNLYDWGDMPDTGDEYGGGYTIEDRFGSESGIGYGASGAGTLSGYGGCYRYRVTYSDIYGVIDGYASGEANYNGCGDGHGGANGRGFGDGTDESQRFIEWFRLCI